LTFPVKDENKFIEKNEISVFTKKHSIMEQSCKSGYCRKKLSDIIKENNDLLEKVDQLDEDTDIGLNLLKNCQEREKNLKKELKEHKANSNKTDEIMKQMRK
jgi:hypothetical protein